MNRRNFIKLTSLTLTSLAFAKENQKEWSVIESVSTHLLPISKEINFVRYLEFVSRDESFEDGDLDFLLRGAKEVVKRGYKDSLSTNQKEKILREFEKSRFGESWLSTLLNYTLEAVFCDPIYGGNKNKKGWVKFNHHPGLPRPTKPFERLS